MRGHMLGVYVRSSSASMRVNPERITDHGAEHRTDFRIGSRFARPERQRAPQCQQRQWMSSRQDDDSLVDQSRPGLIGAGAARAMQKSPRAASDWLCASVPVVCHSQIARVGLKTMAARQQRIDLAPRPMPAATLLAGAGSQPHRSRRQPQARNRGQQAAARRERQPGADRLLDRSRADLPKHTTPRATRDTAPARQVRECDRSSRATLNWAADCRRSHDRSPCIPPRPAVVDERASPGHRR